MYDGLKNLEVPRSPGKHPRARRFARAGVIGVAIFAVLIGGTGIYVYQKVTNALDKTHRVLPTDEPLPDEPINILVVGSDRRDVISKKERRKNPELRGPEGQRSDTMILVHISAKAERAVAMSLPRDLRVDVPGHGIQKLNAAYAIGGPKLTIRTVKQFTGLPIHHYVEINFASFQSIVDAVGGVNVCVTQAYDEPKSGLRIPRAGCYDMEGQLALAYVRARYIGTGSDLDRIERQQQFIRALMKRVKSVRFLFNLPRVTKLADALAQGGVITSQKVSLGVVRNVAAKLSSSQKKVDFRIVPGYPQYIDRVSYVLPNEEQAGAVFAAMREDRPLPPYGKTGASLPKPKDVTVTVLNGSGKDGLATRQADKLRARGFQIASIGTASRTYAHTTIVYAPGDDLKAELLARRYPGSRIRQVVREQSTVVLILGKDRLARAKDASG